jgi:SAM-dependent methyltransferase
MNNEEVVLDLGSHYVSGFVNTFEEAFEGDKYPLKLIWDAKMGCPVLSEQPPFDMMWGKYWYQSGINGKMVKDLHKVVDAIGELIIPKSEDIWLDIACNDGTLLKYVNDKYHKVGCDPVKGTIAQIGESNSDTFINDYFTFDKYFNQLERKAKVITCCAMFYDLQEPIKFLQDVYDCLLNDGVFVFQFTYTPTMLLMGDFMNICHEHYAYHDFNNVLNMLTQANFSVFNVELNGVNGGSVRIYCSKQDNPYFCLTPAERTIGKVNIEAIAMYETNPLIDWKKFKHIMNINRMNFVDFIRKANVEGKSVWGYGASTKANTLLQYYELNYNDIYKIAEANEDKFGKYTKGSGIEICSEDEWRENSPDITIVFPFQFIDYFVEREKDYLQNGGTFLVPCPVPHIISKHGIINL